MVLGLEGATLTDATLEMHRALVERHLPAAITLQAYLKRTEADLGPLIRMGAKVRLVKGAYAVDPGLAFLSRAHLTANWHRLIDRMLSKEARDNGFYPIIATHDGKLHAYTRERAAANGWMPGEYEMEMLLGVRNSGARDLVRAGEKVRLYMPFGHDWFPYTIQRIGDNPVNAWMLARSIISKA